jgi:hypothetical protein
MLRRHFAFALFASVALFACTSIRVTGFVTDESTGEPVGGCGISFGQLYTNSDAAGHFVINGRKNWEEMRVIAAGYESKSVPVDASDTRYPVIYIQLTPRLKTDQGQEASPQK